MLISRGIDLNAVLCSLPLHLACKLGHAHIVQMLLDAGAKADLPRRVCYPVTHQLRPAAGAAGGASASGGGGAGAKGGTAAGGAKFQCRVALRAPAQPIAYAIPSDRHEVLRVLLTHRTSWDVVKKEFLLHEACKFRAKRCLKLLVEMLPEEVRQNLRRRRGWMTN